MTINQGVSKKKNGFQKGHPNGITLCQAHHPRKRAEEKRLVPVLQRLVINTIC